MEMEDSGRGVVGAGKRGVAETFSRLREQGKVLFLRHRFARF
jgi:hypothetical protein